MKNLNELPIDLLLKSYISEQNNLVYLEYKLEVDEKKKNEIENADLIFTCLSEPSADQTRIWTTTLPLPKNLIPPESLNNRDPTYVNISDKMTVKILESGESFEGKVIKIKEGEITASFELKWEGDSQRYECSIQFLPNDVVFKRKLAALTKLYNLNNNLKKMLCRQYPKKRIKKNIPLNFLINPKVNKSQKEAIRMALLNPFSLIQGPPGTGKTYTIGAIAIQALINEPHKKVLICGTTNVSINSLLEIVGDMVQSNGFKVCWPASSSRDFTSEENLTKEQKLMALYKCRHMDSVESQMFRELMDKRNRTDEDDLEIKRLRQILEQRIIKESNVIFSTLDSSGKKSIINNIGEISILIVDEATLSVESSMIIPLSLCPDRFVLVGDHKQLGPEPSFKELQRRKYYISMFERIIKQKSCLENSVMLKQQYRMHPIISKLPNELFYGNQLLNGVTADDRKISEKFKIQTHFNFINMNGKEEKSGTSFMNVEELNGVVNFVNSLIESDIEESDIGVISAYGAQTHLISEKLKSEGLHVKVSTIDSFQGSQKDYIIICTTRNGPTLGFVANERRMNVAITRARRMVTIFGNEKTLSRSKHWSRVIEYAKKCNSFFYNIPIKVEKKKCKPLVITKNKDSSNTETFPEFKEDKNNAGYNLKEIKPEFFDCKVRVLWPDEKSDQEYLKEWVQERINLLNQQNKYVTLAYDAESVCMQFGDIFDHSVNYYKLSSTSDIPKIKTNESIIISFYQHKNNYDHDPILIKIMKPLLEHPKITLITFDFIYDLDKLYEFNVNIKTKYIIDAQLMYLPDTLNDENDDSYIRSTGWKSLAQIVKEAKENINNDAIIKNAKDCIKKNKKNFPHDENSFLIEQFKYSNICHFTQLFLEYSACDIIYTSIAGIDILSRDKLESVKERSLKKFNSYSKFRKLYGNVKIVREAFYIGEHFTKAMQNNFSKDNETWIILSLYKTLNSYVNLDEKHFSLLNIPNFGEKEYTIIKNRYTDIVNIMKDPESEHLKNIRDNAVLSYAGVTEAIIEVKDQKLPQPKIERMAEIVEPKISKMKPKRKKRNQFVYTPGDDDSNDDTKFNLNEIKSEISTKNVQEKNVKNETIAEQENKNQHTEVKLEHKIAADTTKRNRKRSKRKNRNQFVYNPGDDDDKECNLKEIKSELKIEAVKIKTNNQNNRFHYNPNEQND